MSLAGVIQPQEVHASLLRRWQECGQLTAPPRSCHMLFAALTVEFRVLMFS